MRKGVSCLVMTVGMSALAIFVSGCVSLGGKAPTVKLVELGKPLAYVRIQEGASPSERLAANELRDYIKKISGAMLVVSSTKRRGNAIMIGTLKSLKKLPSEVRSKLSGAKNDDSFYLKTAGETVYVVGREPLGALYGAYTLLERLGVKWLYPGEQGECVPTNKNISVSLDDFETPSLDYCSVCLTCASYNFAPTLIWMARNKMKIRSTPGFRLFDGCTKKQAEFFNAARGAVKPGGGHSCFSIAIPAKKYFKTHPEYFPLLDGKRVCEGRVQRCISNPDVQKIYEDVVCEYEKKGTRWFFGAEDRVGTFCQCDNCRKMGTVDGKFSITNLVHRFFSKIASRVEKRVPDAKFYMHIYTDYRDVPTASDIKYSDAMLGLYCSHQRCYVHEFSDPKCLSNKKQYGEFKEWLKICPRESLRDYIEIADCEYAPFEYVVGKDIKNLVKIGASGWTDECPPAYGRMVTKLQKSYPKAVDQWLSNWPTYYVAAQVGWNSGVDVDKLMKDAYEAYYGKAAVPMLEYQDLRRKLWESAPGHAFYGGPVRTGYCLTVPGVEEKLDACLKRAEKLAAGDKTLMKRIAMDKDFLTRYWKKAAEVRKKLFSAAKNIIPQKTDGKIKIDGKLSEDVWIKARPVTGFVSLRNNGVPQESTSVRVAYDDDNIYFGIVAMNDKAWSPGVAKVTKHDGNVWSDDSVELQIAPSKNGDVFYHIMSNIAGVVYDSKMSGSNMDKSFDSACEVKVSKLKDRFIYEFRIPLKSLGGTAQPGQVWRMHFIRNCKNLQPPATKETSTIDGTNPHALSDFRRAVFGVNIVKNGNFAVLEKYKKKINGLNGGLFPKNWGVVSSSCSVAKKGNGNTETFKTGTIYSYLGVFSRLHDGKLTITANASGKGKIYGVFRTWMTDKSDWSKRLNQKIVTTKKFPLSGKTKSYAFTYDFKKGEHGYFYLYVAGEVTANDIAGTVSERSAK